jgi:type IV pilus assembly protein PilM
LVYTKPSYSFTSGNIVVSALKNLFSNKSKGVGIELSANRINIAQLQRKGTALKLAALASVPLPEGLFQEGQITDPTALAELIQAGLSEAKVKVKRVATAIPGREVVTRLIPVPSELDDIELREMILEQEAGLYLPFPREEADVDYQKLGLFIDEDGIEKVQILLAATRKQVTDSYLNTFQLAGLELDVLETTSFALIRTIREQLRQFSAQEAVAIVDIEYESTEISIVVQGVPQFSRTVPIGTSQMLTALSHAMNLPNSGDMEVLQTLTIPVTPADSMSTGRLNAPNPGTSAMMRILGELADELRRSIAFYLSQGEGLEIAQLLLAGPGGAINQLDEYFTQRLSYPALQIDPVSALALELDETLLQQIRKPELGVVLGLGLREA